MSIKSQNSLKAVRFIGLLSCYGIDTKELISMKMNNVIELSQYRRPETFDYASVNRRAASRYRNSEVRAWIMHTVETAVTGAIGICSLCCVYLAFTML